MSPQMKTTSMIEDLVELVMGLSPERRVQMLGVFGLMVLSAFAELVTLGAVIPFVGLLVQPQIAFEADFVRAIASLLGLTRSEDLLAPMTAIFALAAILAGTARVLLIRVSTRLAFMIGADIGADVFSRTMAAPYETHANRNSSEVISGVTRKVDGVVRGIILAMLNIASSTLIFTFSIGALLVIEWRATVSIITVFGAIYYLISLTMRRRLKRYGQTISQSEGQVFRALSEGLGGIREVLLHGKQDHFRRRFREHDIALRNAQANSLFVSQFPRYALEAVAVVLIAFAAYGLTTNSSAGDGISGLPILAAIALGGQRMLPALQLIYAGWSQLIGYRPILEDVLELLRQKQTDNGMVARSIGFSQKVTFDDVSFSYTGSTEAVLQGLTLEIPRGSCVGLIGETGSGKSTLVDLFMGLLTPTSGHILIDETPIFPETLRSWQDRIAHVPQAIYLTDGSFAENIAWSETDGTVDLERVKRAAHQAQIDTMIERTDGGYAGLVGENGIRLSGGQRQRIGIARALYRNPEVLVFDEATSALDGETETAVVHTLEQLKDDLTIVMIAHRLSTLRNCDIIFRLDEGRIIWSGRYEDMLAQSRVEIN